ncbi:MAG: hypothetical protein Kow0069_14580 [Promethearchaeota archaeon]
MPEVETEVATERDRRIRWVDQGRGLVMFLLVLTLAFPPDEWKSEAALHAIAAGQPVSFVDWLKALSFFLFGHPGRDATYMTIFDVGAAAFVFVIGLMFSISVRKRLESGGTREAVKYVVVRYGLLLLLGYLIMAAGGELVYESERVPGVPVLNWDVIPTLGLVGFVALPFAYVKDPKTRLLAAVLVAYTAAICWYLYKNRRTISTQKATAAFIVVTIVLAVLLMGLGVI